MKKLICYFRLLLVFVLSIVFFSCADLGANNELTVEEMITAAAENIQEVKNYDMTMDMEMIISSQEQTAKMNSSASGTVFIDPIKMKLNMQIGISGINQDLEIYTEQDGNDIYVYTKMFDSWQKDTFTAEAFSAIQQYNVKGDFSLYLENAKNFEVVGTEVINNRDAYKIEGKISGQSLETMLSSNNYMNMLNSMGIDSSMLREMYKDMEDIPFIMWVDKEKLYPVKYDMDITAVMSKIMDNVSSTDGAEILQDIKFDKFFITATMLNFNAATDFEVPAEAKN